MFVSGYINTGGHFLFLNFFYEKCEIKGCGFDSHLVLRNIFIFIYFVFVPSLRSDKCLTHVEKRDMPVAEKHPPKEHSSLRDTQKVQNTTKSDTCSEAKER